MYRKNIIFIILILCSTVTVLAQVRPSRSGVPNGPTDTGPKPTDRTLKPGNTSSQQNGKVTIGGINYSLNAKRKTAEVVSGDYSGDITIPSTVTYKNVKYRVTSILGVTGNIHYGAFFGCDRVTSVTIPSSIKSIKEHSFEDCTNLKSVNIPNSVTSIGVCAFSGCSSLTSITIPNSVTSIRNWAFSGCPALTSIIVSKGNAVYDSRNNCNAIIDTKTNTLIAGCKNTIIPNSVTSIGDFAFSGCSGLTSITIPNSVTSIGDKAFSDCSALTYLSVSKENTIYDSRNNCNAIIETSSNTLIVGCKNTVIPNSVTSVGYDAFSECSGLISINIPSSVKDIKGNPFQGCDNLSSITVSAGNTVYDSRNYCNAIIETNSNELIVGCKNTVIPYSVENIGSWAFADCSGLTSITIPQSVTSIDSEAFDGCEKLQSITCLATEVPGADDFAFYNESSKVKPVSQVKNATLYVPSEAIDEYKNTYPWSGFKTILPIK